MKIIKIIIPLMFLVSNLCFSQEVDENSDEDKNIGLFGNIQLSYVNVTNAWEDIPSASIDINTDDAYAFSINFLTGYYVIPKRLSLGVGFGLDGYHSPSYNTAPLYGDVRFFWSDERNAPYINLAYGVLVNLGDDFHSGQIFKIGAGYKFFISNKICLNADISYAPKEIDIENTVERWQSVNIQGVALSFGVYLF